MIREDYFLRMVQEFVEALLRAGFLKRKKEYAAALETIDQILVKFQGTPADELAFDQLLALCAEAGDESLKQMVVVADLLNERGELLQLEGRATEAVPSFALSLGLHLEAMQTGRVSLDQINKVERLIALASPGDLPPPVLPRLAAYFEARGRFSRSEDLLFEGLERGDATIVPLAMAFYERLEAKTDADLSAGGLPRDEVEEGRRAVAARIQAI